MDREELQQRLLDLNDQQEQIVAKCKAERRDPTEEERKSLDAIQADFERSKQDLERLDKLDEQSQSLRQRQGRRTQPEGPADDNRLSQTGDLPVAPQRLNPLPRVPAEPIRQNNGGFKTLGDMALCVQRFCSPGGTMDPRLERLAPTAWGNEGSGADGGFAVPPDFKTQIMEKVLAEDSLLTLTDQQTSSGNSITLPVDETTPWQTSGGVLAYWENEAGQMTQSKPELQERTIRLNKLTALVPMSDELLEDAPSMTNFLLRKAPAKINFKMNLAIVQGTGAGQPLGIINSPSYISVTKVSSQAADTIVAANLAKMWMRLYGPCRRNAVWLANQDIEEQLAFLMKIGKLDTGAADTGWGVQVPYYNPDGPNGPTLKGRPLIFTQATETLGDVGDLLLVDLTQYMTVLKSGANPRVDVSMHLFFDYGLTAFRFVLRVAGLPHWGSTIAARDGSNTYSWAVGIEAR